jgi:serine/threonine kinase 16
MAQVFFDLISSFGSCLNCFPSSPTLKINSRSFKILRLLGEVRPPAAIPATPK